MYVITYILTYIIISILISILTYIPTSITTSIPTVILMYVLISTLPISITQSNPIHQLNNTPTKPYFTTHQLILYYSHLTIIPDLSLISNLP